MNIYEIKGNFLELQDLIESGDYDEDVLQDTLEAIQGEFEVKAEGYGQVITNLDNLVEGLKSESQRFISRAKSIEINIERMKGILKDSLLDMGLKNVKTEHFAFATRRSERLEILDESMIYGSYIKTKVLSSVDKTRLKKDIKNGLVCNGAEITDNYSLQIK